MEKKKKEYTSVIDQVSLTPLFVLKSSKWGSCPLCRHRGWWNLDRSWLGVFFANGERQVAHHLRVCVRACVCTHTCTVV